MHTFYSHFTSMCFFVLVFTIIGWKYSISKWVVAMGTNVGTAMFASGSQNGDLAYEGWLKRYFQNLLILHFIYNNFRD